MDFKETRIKRISKYKNDFLELIEDDVRLPDGREAKRVVVKHVGAASALPITDNGEVVLVRQHRYAIGRDSLEIPAGKKDFPGEHGMSCARREMMEETGYDAATLTPLSSIYSAIGFSDELVEIFLAPHARPTDSPEGGDDDEFVDVVIMPFSEALKRVDTGEIQDAKTVVALLAAARHYPFD